MGIDREQLSDTAREVRLPGKTQYLDGAHAVVTHTVDDTNQYLSGCIDAMDRYGIKATLFVTTGYQHHDVAALAQVS